MTRPDLSEPTVHKQFEIDDPNGGTIWVDEGIYLLLSHVWRRGLKTRSSCQGSGPTPLTELPYIIFPEIDDGVEFLKSTAALTDYRMGDMVGLAIVHPMIDLNGEPEAKVSWLPRYTIPLINAWGET